MQSKVGYSANSDVREAVEEATRGIANPAGLIIMTDHERLPEIAAVLQRKYPDAQMIGTSGINYYNRQSSDQNLIVTALLDGASCCAGYLTRLSTSPLGDLSNLQDAIRAVGGEKDNTIVLQYCTNDEERLTTTLNVALDGSGIRMIGGSVFGYPEGEAGQVAVNGRIYEDACAFMVIKNETGKVRVYRENIYDRIPGGKPHLVTKVDLQTKTLIELDHRPAADVYTDELGVPRDRIIDNVLQNPMGRVVGDQIYISSQKSMLSNGAMTLFKRLNENDTIYFLELQNYQDINHRTIKQVQADFKNISLAISVNCIYRYLLFTQKGYYNRFLGDMSKLGNFVGNIGGGEQIDKQHVNQTMVMAVFD
ncbi:MAG: FIST N-terminal domain-containing protein [Bacillota bacterium]|nr:FIST N-terminal domain-containing protein [Bacillota bacterium]